MSNYFIDMYTYMYTFRVQNTTIFKTTRTLQTQKTTRRDSEKNSNFFIIITQFTYKLQV